MDMGRRVFGKTSARYNTAPNSKIREFHVERKWETYSRCLMAEDTSGGVEVCEPLSSASPTNAYGASSVLHAVKDQRIVSRGNLTRNICRKGRERKTKYLNTFISLIRYCRKKSNQ